MKTYKIMLGFTILAAVGGILTMIPWPSASYPNILGYKSLCTFAPSAAFFCFLAAGLCCFLRAAFIKDRSGTNKEKFIRHAHSFIPLGIIAVIAVVLMIRFIDIKADYTSIDSTTAASSEGYDE